MNKNILKLGNRKLKPESLRIKPFGEVIGKYPVPFLQKLFKYAEEYDVERGHQDKGYIFDRRLSAINVWDWDKGLIHTTLYADWTTGGVYLERNSLKDESNWTSEEATKFWNRVFGNISSNTPTLLLNS